MSLILNHRLIDADLNSILLALKHNLNNGKLKDIINKGDNYLVTCPHHKFGQENHPSCQIYCGTSKDLEFGTWHCFTCGSKGNLAQFVGECFDQDEIYGQRWLLDNFGDTYVVDRPDMLPITFDKNKQIDVKPNIDLKQFIGYHPYMDKRKITEQVRKEFQIKYNPKMNSIVFPVWDVDGNLVMLTQRSVDSKQFYIDRGVEKPIYLFNRVVGKNYPFVIITEAQIDALTCWGYGVPACAFIGLGSDKQYEILNNNRIKCWVTMFDNDQAGRDATQRFNRLIRKDLFVINIEIPNGKKDINDLSEDEFNQLLDSYNLTWRLPFTEN